MKKTWIVCTMLITGFFLAPQLLPAQPQTFPNRSIEMVVPFNPGGTADIATRIVMDQLSKELNVHVAVLNKGGASGTIGAKGVAEGNPDGHLLVVGNVANFINSYFFLKSVPFDTHKDFIPLGYAGESPSLLVVPRSSPFKTFAELIDYGKNNPGKLSYAAAGGLSSTASMNMEFIKSKTGIDIARIVYEGGGPATAAVLGEHVSMTYAGLPSLRAHIIAGTLRPLATSKKIDEFPQVPSFAEVQFPDILVNWTGFFAPVKIPKANYDILVKAFDAALKNSETIAKLKKAGYIPEIKTPAEITQLLKDQYLLVSQIVKEAKLVK